MNSITLVGRLTRDPEKRATPGGTDVSVMRLAIAKSGNGGGSDFVNVTAFGKLAQSCNSYLAEGRQVAIQGRLNHSEWQTESGERRERHEVVAASVEFLGQRPAPAAAEAQPAIEEVPAAA